MSCNTERPVALEFSPNSVDDGPAIRWEGCNVSLALGHPHDWESHLDRIFNAVVKKQEASMPLGEDFEIRSSAVSRQSNLVSHDSKRMSLLLVEERLGASCR
ncbi:hypothetical protein CEP54_009548 [Fusarium duplospermum]|uniref:Uncharacterized protein n=1 Tax=Fusarium duplospermum TaxID=1325734 RepID=A0A428PPZ5_9HYPO|nr:hypothetical protein CEP54_009548 [Fusarium duplospermum]